MKIIVEPRLSDVVGSGSVLLINAPAIDTRIPWANWQQPLGLLQIGTSLKAQGCSVRLIDCLQMDNNRLSRSKIGEIKTDGYKINLWQFGFSPKKIVQTLLSWREDGWFPQTVLISSGLSCWWQGVKTVIDEIRNIFSGPIVVGGPYPTAYPEHAQKNLQADFVVTGRLRDLQCIPTDFDIYAPLKIPKIAAITFFTRDDTGLLRVRSPEIVSEEIKEKCELGVSSFVWYDEWLLPEHKEGIIQILDAIVTTSPKVRGSRLSPSMIAPGNFSPRLIDVELAMLLMKANFHNISLHDDLIHQPFEKTYLSSLEDYYYCMQALVSAGFSPRYGEVDAALVVGLPGEDLEVLTKRMIQLSSIVGSIHLLPYQYSPNNSESFAYTDWLAKHNGHYDLTSLNGRLFPLARISGAKLSDYWELTRLMALLNSRFHSQTFDFLGDSITSRMVQKSLRSQLWNPFAQKSDVKQGDL